MRASTIRGVLMTEFFEAFSNGARHLREEREFQQVNVVQAKRSGRGPQPLDLESGRIVLVRPVEHLPGVQLSVCPAEARDFPTVARIAVRAYLDAGDLRHDDPYVDVLRDVEGRSREAEVWVVMDDVGPPALPLVGLRPGSGAGLVSAPRRPPHRLPSGAPEVAPAWPPTDVDGQAGSQPQPMSGHRLPVRRARRGPAPGPGRCRRHRGRPRRPPCTAPG
ncbi:hypothetical protein EDD41_2195 [Luteococcus japonicus]|uniref:Uncharacterized protein n=1 Tax=Luteococcus japonicus TaxID=33984 RepID=A0A3N1ZWV3_9ACTN|nr:hypothetical protein EDD41_2195 [Luteococcus japonicus]